MHFRQLQHARKYRDTLLEAPILRILLQTRKTHTSLHYQDTFIFWSIDKVLTSAQCKSRFKMFEFGFLSFIPIKDTLLVILCDLFWVKEDAQSQVHKKCTDSLLRNEARNVLLVHEFIRLMRNPVYWYRIRLRQLIVLALMTAMMMQYQNEVLLFVPTVRLHM